MKKWIMMAFLGLQINLYAQDKKIITDTIQTTAECGECKERVEGKLNYTKGIKFAELDVESKKLIVKFDQRKISEAEIKAIVSSLGYDADEVKANKEAYDALPNCCKIGGM